MDRYHRQTILSDFGPQAQSKLRRAKVLCIGLGGLGSPAALYLAAAGIGKLGLVDGDQIAISNLQRQILYANDEAGLAKVQIAAEKLRALNPEVEIEAYPFYLDAENANSLFSNYDLILDGTDNFAGRVLINAAALLARKPVVFGSVLKFEGRVTIFNGPPGPCYRCLFPTEPPPEFAPNCAEAGVIGALPGMIGSLQALEAIKFLTGVGQPLTGRLLRWDALSGRATEIQIQRDPDCAHCADLARLTLPRPTPGLCLPVKEISWEEFQSQLERKLLDVREPEEFFARHLPDAENIPLAHLAAKSESWRRDQAVVVYCRAGHRGAAAARLLAGLGFTSVANLAGGIDAVVFK